MSTATRNGPLVPMPKPLASASYAWRAVVDFGSCPTSCWPSLMSSTGRGEDQQERGRETSESQGWRATPCAQRAQPCGRSSCAWAAWIGTLWASIRIPSSARSAGIRVTAAITAIATTIAAE